MRNIVNISLPPVLAKHVRAEAKEEGYASVSEYFRHVLRVYNTEKIARGIKKSQEEFRAGKGKVLKSLRDLR